MPRQRLGNIEIHYLDEGAPSERPPLVLLHGLGSSCRDWQWQLPDFARGRRVIVPDLRGFGESDKPAGPYPPSLFATDVIALLDALGIARCDLLGYSMGGAAAFQMAVDHPERIRRLILLNTSPSFELDTFKMRRELWLRLAVIRLLGPRRMAAIIAKRLFPREDQQELRELTIERYGANSKEAYIGALQGLAGWTIGDALEAIPHPTLVVAAEHDYTPLELKQQWSARMRDARLEVIEGSRHGTPMDAPEQLNALVLAFLDEAPQVATRSSTTD